MFESSGRSSINTALPLDHDSSSTITFSTSMRFRIEDMSPVRVLSRSSVPFAIFLLISLLTLVIPSIDATTYLHNESKTDFEGIQCLRYHLLRNAELLPSWKNDSSIPYCRWPGVRCSKRHPFRVVALDLESLDLSGQIPPCISNLTFLTRIHLPQNQLSGLIPTELGKLHRLRYLNLSSNNLSGMIPMTLSSCFGLQILDLANNALSKCIPEGIGMLRSLSVLRLSGNALIGNIPLSLGSSSSLVSVVLSNNSLTGTIPPLLVNSSSLQVLSVTKNHLSGEIPPALFNSTSLQKLALGLNHFVGFIPSLSNIGSPLQYLILQSNDLVGIIPSSLGNFSYLYWLLLGENYFHGRIPWSIGEIPGLHDLELSYNMLSGTVPASFYNMSALTYLSMAENNLTGEIPYNIGYTLPSIQTLIMQANRIGGQIPTSLANATNLEVINLRNNSFHGVIPSFGTLPNLVELNLGLNKLASGDWSFLSSLANCTKLVILKLEANILEGVLPSSVAELPKSLELLFLAANKISGTIPQEIEHLTNLTLLRMEQNLLTGNLPSSIGNLPNLFVLSLSQNKLSGHIPLSIGHLSELNELYLQENSLSGPIPGALGQCQNLETLNLSWNSFYGRIPNNLFTLTSLSQSLDLSHNQLSGEIPLGVGAFINLGSLNISNNQFSGQVPSTLGECVHLESLNMEANILDGMIPQSFANLRGIVVMDLSQNNLSGEIPEFFENFSDINLLNLSFNNLEGPVPSGGIFQIASAVFIQGNKKLCASSPLLQLPLCNSKDSREGHNFKILKILGLLFLSFVLLASFTVALLKKKNKVKQDLHPSFKGLKQFSYADLVKATNCFSLGNLIGSGRYGSVYKGTFELEEHTVAVKVFKLDQVGGLRSFLAECEALRNIRHRNLVKVISVCSTFDPSGHQFKALILEYMSNGSLEGWLYPKKAYGFMSQLSLSSRITIAVDVASALDYLHNHCMPPIVHCDLKPSNVLLDDVMVAHLADFGLSKFLHGPNTSLHQSSSSLLGPRGSIGYIAPEYGFGSKLSTEADVYSYGIIILEMLTGRRPTDETVSNNGLNLHKFVARAFPHETSEVLDPCIASSFEDGESRNNLEPKNHAAAEARCCVMHQLVKIGLSCSVETPKDRPTIQEVYAQVISIKEAFAALGV